jgi:hypothetical protein
MAIGVDYFEFEPEPATGERFFDSSIGGSVFWNGPGSGGVWLSTRYSLDLDVSAATFANGDKQIRLDGIVSGLTNSGLLDAIIFNNVEFAIGALTCQQEPAGNLLVHDTNGFWYEMNFQGSRDVTDDEATAPDCDGVGSFVILDVVPDPQQPTTVNPNFNSLSSWGGRPWL